MACSRHATDPAHAAAALTPQPPLRPPAPGCLGPVPPPPLHKAWPLTWPLESESLPGWPVGTASHCVSSWLLLRPLPRRPFPPVPRLSMGSWALGWACGPASAQNAGGRVSLLTSSWAPKAHGYNSNGQRHTAVPRCPLPFQPASLPWLQMQIPALGSECGPSLPLAIVAVDGRWPWLGSAREPAAGRSSIQFLFVLTTP